jgi:hypothetical protein
MGVWPSALILIACALAIGWLRWPLVGVVLVLGVSGFVWAWHRLSVLRRRG